MTPIQHLNLHMSFAGPGQKWRRYFEPVISLSDELQVPILGIMLLIWQLRDKDLQGRFPLDTAQNRREFITWCVCHGRNEYTALAEATQFWADLNEKADLELPTRSDPGHAITKLMLLIRQARDDLPFDLSTRVGRAQFVVWYLIHGRVEIGLNNESLPPWQIAYFDSPSEMPGLNYLQAIVYESRLDLQTAFDLPTMNANFLNWYRRTFVPELKLSLKTDYSRLVSPSEKEYGNSNGVTVIGYAFGQLGIGEDARMATQALSAAKVDTVLINFRPGDDVPQNDRSMQAYVQENSDHNVSMFCLTALETGRFFAERGSTYFSRYSIGYWPWELETWPEEWQHLFTLVDEVWASSMHTYKSVFSHSPVPVKHVPMAVELPKESSLTRRDFNLPESAKLFCFSFDLNSTAKRKNPSACVKAFLNSFPAGNSELSDVVGLVIKVHPPKSPNAEWEMLRNLRDKDSRIHLIESTLPKEDLLALYKMCDCFVSLHRAEGFGRNIAEAMLLGMPVICTGYSGNIDFTNHINSFLVGYEPIYLADGDYPYGEGKFWAEPSVSEAAEFMRAIAEDTALATELSKKAQENISTQYNIVTIGQRYRFELEKFWSSAINKYH